MTTKYRGNEAERKALDAYIKLMRASESVTNRLKRHSDRSGLTMSQLGVLEALLQDRRFVTVSLTQRGRTLIEDVFPRHAEAIVEAMAALGDDEQRALAELCRKLGLAAAGP